MSKFRSLESLVQFLQKDSMLQPDALDELNYYCMKHVRLSNLFLDDHVKRIILNMTSSPWKEHFAELWQLNK
tara:strand:- start:695 stop:910 length:216 start_codon:yes stop_codon:yes gene_type:complete